MFLLLWALCENLLQSMINNDTIIYKSYAVTSYNEKGITKFQFEE
jgi:hypothetical protein